MLNKLREKIKGKRGSKNAFWVILFSINDFYGRRFEIVREIIRSPFLYLFGSELIRQFTPYYAKGFEEKIRLGRPCDGGYVLPIKMLPLIDVVYSYGVGHDISFEKDLLERKKIPFRFYDNNIDKLPFQDEKFFFKKQNIATKKYGDFDTFQNHLVQNNDTDKRILLKIDIEGGEWKVIDEIIAKNYKNIIAIILELHELGEFERIPLYNNILKHINSKFTIVHIHGNNADDVFRIKHRVMPKICELTLINNNFITERNALNLKLPSRQDFPNCPGKEDIRLDFWINTK